MDNSSKQKMFSICIPTYEMHGEGERLLTRSFDMLLKQTYKDFEVVVSDNSQDSVIENLCKNPKYQTLNIRYAKYAKRGISPNTNNSMRMATGTYIKILHMDDYLYGENALLDIVNNLKGAWMVTGCAHDAGDGKIINEHYPTYNKYVYLGKNTIGNPSVLTIKNDSPLMFDERLVWLCDCDHFRRYYDTFGEPTILNKVNVIIGSGKHQTTSSITRMLVMKERLYVWLKYNCKILLKFFNYA
jgi:glycosyltransferase involved in cell wall biosynthesis